MTNVFRCLRNINASGMDTSVCGISVAVKDLYY